MKTGPSKLKPIIGYIFREGVIMPTVSPFNNSVWPIFKLGKNKDASQWVTKILMPLSYLLRSLPNISEIVGSVQTASGKYFTLEDLVDKCSVQCPLQQPLSQCFHLWRDTIHLPPHADGVPQQPCHHTVFAGKILNACQECRHDIALMNSCSKRFIKNPHSGSAKTSSWKENGPWSHT